MLVLSGIASVEAVIPDCDCCDKHAEQGDHGNTDDHYSYYNYYEGDEASRDSCCELFLQINITEHEAVVPASWTEIPDFSFYRCTLLETLTFETGSQLTKIGNYAFSFHPNRDWTYWDKRMGHSRLQNVKFPPSLTTIGEYAFASTIPGSVVIPESVTTIGEYAYSNCTITDFAFINPSITKINKGTFAYTNVESFPVPLSVVHIDDDAFIGCEYLKSVEFRCNEEKLYIGPMSFTLTPLQTIAIPPNTEYVGNVPTTTLACSFVGMSCYNNALACNCAGQFCDISGTLGDGDDVCQEAQLGHAASGNDGLQHACQPGSYSSTTGMSKCLLCPLGTWTSESQAQSCTACPNGYSTLTTGSSTKAACNVCATGYNGTATVNATTNSGCSLCDSSLPFSIVGNNQKCTILSCESVDSDGYIIIPCDVASKSFAQCTKLKHVYITNAVTSIGNNAFEDCYNLAIVEFQPHSQLTSIGEYAFSASALTSIAIPANTTTIGEYAYGYSPLLSEVSFTSNSKLMSINTGTYKSTRLKTFNVPASVTTIRDQAFSSCGLLKSVNFLSGSTLKTIGNEAFKSTAITEINLPYSVTSVGSNAFTSCTDLTSFTISGDVCNSDLETIGLNAFENCPSLTSIELNPNSKCNNCGVVTFPALCTSSSVVNTGIQVSLSDPSIMIQLAGYGAIVSFGTGIYYTFLRKGSNAVQISVAKAGVIMGLIGGEFVTTLGLAFEILHSEYRGWGMVIVSMRLMHILIAIAVLTTIYGGKTFQSYTDLIQLLDRKHMASNPKMYSLASIFCLFDIKAIALLPWVNSEFARQSFGTAPNMAMFRVTQWTTIFTSLFSILSQGEYLNDSVARNTSPILFYINISLAGTQIVISLLAYCMTSEQLAQCKTTLDNDGVLGSSTGTDGTDGTSSFADDAIEIPRDGHSKPMSIELIDVIPNPLQSKKSGAGDAEIGMRPDTVIDTDALVRQAVQSQIAIIKDEIRNEIRNEMYEALEQQQRLLQQQQHHHKDNSDGEELSDINGRSKEESFV